jgi:hypothetical protein
MSIYFKIEYKETRSDQWYDLYHCWSGDAAKRKVAKLTKDKDIPMKQFRIVKVTEEVMKF